jgi:antirestriction protein
MTKTETERRIYVACLASYNSGVLHGRWIDVSDLETMGGEIAAMLRESRFPNVTVDCPECEGTGCDDCQSGKVPSAEEWAVHDFEGFGEIAVGEYPSLGELAALTQAIEEHGEPFLAWAANDRDNREPEEFLESFLGEFDDLADYVAQQWEASGWKADGQWWHPTNYVNWEAMGRDLELNGEVWTAQSDGFKTYVFGRS